MNTKMLFVNIVAAVPRLLVLNEYNSPNIENCTWNLTFLQRNSMNVDLIFRLITMSVIAVQNLIIQSAIKGIYKASLSWAGSGLRSNDLEFGGRYTKP